MLPSIFHMASSHSIGFYRHFDFIVVDVLRVGSAYAIFAASSRSPTALAWHRALLVRDEIRARRAVSVSGLLISNDESTTRAM